MPCHAITKSYPDVWTPLLDLRSKGSHSKGFACHTETGNWWVFDSTESVLTHITYPSCRWIALASNTNVVPSHRKSQPGFDSGLDSNTAESQPHKVHRVHVLRCLSWRGISSFGLRANHPQTSASTNIKTKPTNWKNTSTHHLPYIGKNMGPTSRRCFGPGTSLAECPVAPLTTPSR